MANSEFPSDLRGAVGGMIVHQNHFIHDIHGNFCVSPGEGFLGIVRGQDNDQFLTQKHDWAKVKGFVLNLAVEKCQSGRSGRTRNAV